MQRRGFLTLVGSAIAWPLAAFAQQSSAKVWRIAWLNPGSMDSPADRALFDVCRSELHKLGYVEGKNLVIDSKGSLALMARN
jgi:putative tryptophan/tyrosine transport system substrate-binding protein